MIKGLFGGFRSTMLRHGSAPATPYAFNQTVFPTTTRSAMMHPLLTTITRGKRLDMSKLRQSLAWKIKKYKPRTPGIRHKVEVDRSELWKGKPIKELTEALRKKGGRNHTGQITVRSRGGGHRRRYRIIDFKRQMKDQPGVVQRLEYDPNRTGHIALVKYPEDKLAYMLLCQGLDPGDTIMASRTQELEIKPGNCMPLSSIPLGTPIHNIELLPGKGGQLCRAAGSHATVKDKLGKKGHVLVTLASKEERYFQNDCMATIGVVGNPLHRLKVLGKAGRSRWRGRRPHVRGKAMNPVDHPMGGGEGSRHGGHKSQSPTGVLAKGFKTRRKPRTKLILKTKWQATHMGKGGRKTG